MAESENTHFCEAGDCGREANRKNAGKWYCAGHLTRINRHGNPQLHIPLKLEKLPERYCKAEGCEKPISAKGFCHKHYYRFRRYGDPQKLQSTPYGSGIAFLKSIVGTTETACIIWPYGTSSDRAYLKQDGRHRQAAAISYELNNGPIPDGLLCRHLPDICNNPMCVNPNHLAAGTHKQNTDDMWIAGTMPHGESSYKAKLTESKIFDAIERRENGEKLVDLAAEFGVSPPTLCAALKGRSWKHLNLDV